MKNIFSIILFISIVFMTDAVCGQVEPVVDLSSPARWKGITIDNQKSQADGGVATMAVPGVAEFTYPDDEKGWHRVGMASVHNGSSDWRRMYGIRFEVQLKEDSLLNLDLSLSTVPTRQGSKYLVDTISVKTGLRGQGWHEVIMPLEAFDYHKDRLSILYAIKKLSIRAEFADAQKGKILIKNIRLVKAPIVSLESTIQSKSAKGGDSVIYDLVVSNCTDKSQFVTLSEIVRGREVMETSIEPTQFELAPGENKLCNVKVKVSERVAPGGHEKQVIQAVANGDDAGQIEYITLSYLEHPYILHTPERWDELLQKVKDVKWAKEATQKYIDKADKWNVPEVNKEKISSATNCVYLFDTNEASRMMDVSVAYKLTGDEKYAQKVALFMKRLSDPAWGYPKTMQGCHKSLVQEGGFFQSVAMGYDMVYDSGVFTDEDHAQIARTFRLYQSTIDEHLTRGDFSNWHVAEMCGALYCALAIQDMATANRFLYGPGGFYDEICHGLMADGWWFECSIGYNTWVASEFTQLALAMQPFGVDFQDAYFPATYSPEYNVPYASVEQRKREVYGKPFQKWGPVHKPYVQIKDMWDALIPYADYKGIMFATNDSTEMKLGGQKYEIAYYVYRDPMYAAILKDQSSRDLLYGVAEFPEDTPQLGTMSAYSDNVGVAMLRSKSEGKDMREKIQAVLKYGTNGGYHGHFDRTALNSLMRYNRSFYNPEHIWYSYPNFTYAFFVQTSLPHNMVVVDMKQQEAVESERLLFETGNMLGVTVVETNARWNNPPYGGLVYGWFDGTFREKCWAEGRYMPVPENEPDYGSIGDYSDRVKQRRLLAVTDDYIVLADYLQAPEEHVFDCLFNIKGYKGIEADAKKLINQTDSMNPDPVLAAQLITDCSWYDTTGTTKVSFETQFGKGADNEGTRIYGEDGVLKMDVYSAWPRDREVMVGTLPEAHGVNRKFWYTVKGDDQILTEGKFGAWVLGREEIDVSLDGVEKLTLVTKAEFGRNAKKTLFWGDPVIITEGGKEIKLSELDLQYDKIDSKPESGKDYYGGPVKISGHLFEHTVAANPFKSEEEGTVTVDLTGLNAACFKASVGGDYPLGDETWRRKSLSFRTSGKETRYLTVIEPYEDKNVVESVKAVSADEVEIKLVDGRKHVIQIENFAKGEDIQVLIQEYKNGNLIRKESHNSRETF